MPDRYRSITELSPSGGGNNSVKQVVPSSLPHLCTGCRFYGRVLDPGGGSYSPVCDHEEHPFFLNRDALACELFDPQSATDAGWRRR